MVNILIYAFIVAGAVLLLTTSDKKEKQALKSIEKEFKCKKDEFNYQKIKCDSKIKHIVYVNDKVYQIVFSQTKARNIVYKKELKTENHA